MLLRPDAKATPWRFELDEGRVLFFREFSIFASICTDLTIRATLIEKAAIFAIAEFAAIVATLISKIINYF